MAKEKITAKDVQSGYNKARKGYKDTTGKNLVNSRQNSGINAGLEAADLAANYRRKNNLQRIRNGYRTASQGYHAATGKNILSNRQVAGAEAALGGAELASGWRNMSNAERIAKGYTTAGNAYSAASNKAVPGTATAGAAIQAYNIYQNWSKMNNEQRAAASASLAAAGSAAAGYSVPGVNIALSAYQGVNYAREDNRAGYAKGGAVFGSMGAAAALGATVAATAGIGAVVALAIVAADMAQPRKSKDQSARDWFRKDLQKKGLYNEDFTIDLANGTKANVGLDGHGGQHTVKYADKLVGKNKPIKINAWDIDYTNDLDFTAGFFGKTLTRLLYGGKDKFVDHTGNQIGNGMLSGIGYGKDYTAENYGALVNNARGLFSKAGIQNKEAGFELVSKALEEGRLSRGDAIAAQQALNMMYDDNGYDTAGKVMQGRWVGVDKLADAPEKTSTISVGPQTKSPEAVKNVVGTQDATKTINPTGAPVSDGRAYAPQGTTMSGVKASLQAAMMSKEEVVARNQARYGG